MPFPESVEIGQPIFGGYCPAIPPSQLPTGASPSCSDVAFPEASVGTRGGAKSMFAPMAGLPSVLGLKTYRNGSLVSTLLAWDSLGNLYQENPTGTLAVIAAGGTPGCGYSSTTLFGREYIAFPNLGPLAAGGVDFPRQWDGTNYDRISQEGPGQAPTATDDVDQLTVATAVNLQLTVLTMSQDQVSGIVSISLQISVLNPFSLIALNISRPGDQFTVTGASVSGYNTTYKIAAIQATGQLTAVPLNGVTGLGASTGGTWESNLVEYFTTQDPLTQNWIAGINAVSAGCTTAAFNGTFVIRFVSNAAKFGSNVVVGYLAGTAGGANSTSGTINPVGNITAGLRQVTQAFITRQGYITKPAVPPTSWTAAGGKPAVLTGIAIGPSNVIARILLFTVAIVAPATTGTFYSIAAPVVVGGVQYATAMIINDNTTTKTVVDFRDTDLGVPANNLEYLFGLIEIGECSHVSRYNNRLVLLGERNRLRNLVNLTFNGGWILGGGTSASDLPMGWSSDSTNGAGGSRQANGGVWLDAYRITGDGASAMRGMITQPGYTDYLGVRIFKDATSYSLRVRLKRSAGATGTLNVDLFSAAGGTLAHWSQNLATATQTYAEYSAVLTGTGNLFQNFPDAVLRIYTSGTVPNGQWVQIDSLEPFPTAQPVNTSIAWMSYAFNPESFDATLSQLQITPNDGQSLRAGFGIRGNFYLGKDECLWGVTDDGQNEPSGWDPFEVSNTIGICGPNAVDLGEEWAVLSNRNGAYMFWGADPIKLTQGIQTDASQTGKPAWDNTDWTLAAQVWTRVDVKTKRIVTRLPKTSGGENIFAADYKFAPTGEDAAGGQSASYSAFMNRLIERGGGVKWAPWNIGAASCTLSERPDGTAQMFFGGVNTGLIRQLTDGYYQDDGPVTPIAVNSFYTGEGKPAEQEAEMMQLKTGTRHLSDYLTGKAIGAGTLGIAATGPYRTIIVRGVTLSASGGADFERPINVHGERVYFMVGTNAIGAWFQLEKLVVTMKVDPTIPVKGASA